MPTTPPVIATPWEPQRLLTWLDRIEQAVERLNLFELLELPLTGSGEHVQVAYHQIARTRHPDLFRGRLTARDAERLMRVYGRISAAYASLRDPDERTRYIYELRQQRSGGRASTGPAPTAVTDRDSSTISPHLGRGTSSSASVRAPSPARVTQGSSPSLVLGRASSEHSGDRPAVGRARTLDQPAIGRSPTERSGDRPAVGRAPTLDQPTIGRSPTERSGDRPAVGRTPTPTDRSGDRPAVGRTPTPTDRSGDRPAVGRSPTERSGDRPAVRASSAPPAGGRGAPLSTPPPLSSAPRLPSAVGQLSARALAFYRRAESALASGDLAAATLNLRMALSAEPGSQLLREALDDLQRRTR